MSGNIKVMHASVYLKIPPEHISKAKVGHSLVYVQAA